MSARWGDVATYAVLAVLAVFFAVPFAWLVSLAVRTPAEIYLGAARFIPETPTLDNFRTILSDPAFLIYLWNGLKLSALGGALAVVLAIPAAYACARVPFRGRQVVLVGLLAVQMISPLVILVPLYRWMNALDLLNRDVSVIAVYGALGMPLAVWLLKVAFDAIPIELEEAASIDGASRPVILMRIVLPLARSGIASAFILAMVMNWSQFLIPFILLERDGDWPISVAIFNFAGSVSASTTQLLAAACLVAVMPAVLVFILLQRMIVSALIGGAVKG
ncbi:multiple sugar transport system permease protein [Palleronia marisminoris]|uniref:Maltose/maltodextrin transport system permease protein MalG n=1 Tax=Palleronia marisminoris TaxID=315423 RepID=A0A1Y5RFC5_9RHOB|nr:carbohydrate ABC transporter permease [Palleronia marisminoris]SFG11193.1 multiple sugar transport system permease protein [Palleronia marisminoris]SLN13558.1 Trehalose transport system permease protein SugB [Palleronia marisminoris]